MQNRVFKRKIYSQLLDWKNTRQGRTALLIKGARRIGKSTIAEVFAQREYESYLLIDFNKTDKETYALWDDLTNLDLLFLKLQRKFNVNLTPRKSVIIFDEIQKCPTARQAIKYLVQDGRYDYIETGSLISIRKNTANITIPSEETRINMFPMDFEEFLWALGDEATMPLIRQTYEQRLSLGEAINRQQMRQFRLYMLIGGMPQAINTFLETNNLSFTDQTKREIIDLYLEDFHKLDNNGKAELLFKAAPAQLMNNVSRYQVSTVLKNERADTIAEIINQMKDSMTVNVAYHANDPNVGMLLSEDLKTYKMYVGDTGLFVTLAFWDKNYTENIIYDKLLSDKLSVNLGYVYENVIAQMLRASGNELYYYTFPKDDKHIYEVDFLISRAQKICPIEVKSSGYKTHKSLDEFSARYSSRIGNKYLIYTKDLAKDQDTLCLPAYMTGLL